MKQQNGLPPRATHFVDSRPKRSLNWLGYYMPLEATGVTPLPDRRVFDALRRFQVDHGLSPTGTVKPGDETLARLNRDVARRLKGER